MVSIYVKLPAIENLILEIIFGDTEINVQRGKKSSFTFYLYDTFVNKYIVPRSVLLFQSPPII